MIGSSATAADAAASGRPTSAPLSRLRSPATSASESTSPRSTTRWSTRPESVISTSISRAGVSATSSQVADGRAGQRGVLDDGDLAGELGEQPDAAAQHVVEVDRAVEEGLHGAPLGRGQRLDLREPVDEGAVALVGGDAAGAGVRLGDEPLVLQHGHVVADRGTGHTEIVPVDDHLRSDGLLGAHVVRDDGAQHREPTLLGVHLHLPRAGPAPTSLDAHSGWASARSRPPASPRVGTSAREPVDGVRRELTHVRARDVACRLAGNSGHTAAVASWRGVAAARFGRRWLLVAAGALALAGAAPAIDALPGLDRGAADRAGAAGLRRRILAGAAQPWVGLAEATGRIALPELPALESTTALFTGVTRVRGFVAGPDRWRADELTPVGERDTYRVGRPRVRLGLRVRPAHAAHRAAPRCGCPAPPTCSRPSWAGACSASPRTTRSARCRPAGSPAGPPTGCG